MANAPLAEQVGGSCAFDLPDAATEIFLREGLDRLLVICPSGYFVARIACNWVLSTNPTLALQLRRRGAPDPFQYEARILGREHVPFCQTSAFSVPMSAPEG